jgi:hypothetical protein
MTMSHFYFQNPNTTLTARQICEISRQLEDPTVGIEVKKGYIRQIYQSLNIIQTTQILRFQLESWYRMTNLPITEIIQWLENSLIPTPPKCSDLAKKRRQTPRRRYTQKHKHGSKSRLCELNITNGATSLAT